MTTRTDLSDFSPLRSTVPCPRGHDAMRASNAGVRARRRAWPRLCATMVCTSALWAEPAQASKPRHPHAASSPSTAQILAPSASTVPDALPPDQRIYRCGNTYSPHTCSGATPLDVADARSDTQQRQSNDLTVRDKRLAAWYEAARHERERAPSAPTSGRAASAAAVCTSTNTMTCVPKKPRRRTVSVAGKGKN